MCYKLVVFFSVTTPIRFNRRAPNSKRELRLRLFSNTNFWISLNNCANDNSCKRINDNDEVHKESEKRPKRQFGSYSIHNNQIEKFTRISVAPPHDPPVHRRTSMSIYRLWQEPHLYNYATSDSFLWRSGTPL